MYIKLLVTVLLEKTTTKKQQKNEIWFLLNPL